MLFRSIQRSRPLSAGAYAVVAAGVLVVAGLAGAFTVSSTTDKTIRLAPIVAFRPESQPLSLSIPTMVPPVPLSMPLWPAVFVAHQASWQLASDVARP